MNETLETIQKFAKVGKILSKIIFVCCLVGVIGCLLGGLSLALIGDTVYKIGNVSIHGLIEQSAGSSIESIYTAVAVGFVLSLGECILAHFAVRFFKRELEIGTPFDFSVADELKRLGILALVIPAATSVVAGIVYSVMAGMFEVSENMNLELSSIWLGVGFIALSFIMKYGAQREALYREGELLDGN